MEQIEFMWCLKKFLIPNILQNEKGLVTAKLLPDVLLTHDYKKKNKIEVIFTETQDRFLISSKEELNELCKIYSNNPNISDPIKKYCVSKLNKIN